MKELEKWMVFMKQLKKEKWVVHVSTQNHEEDRNIIVMAYNEQDAMEKAKRKMSNKFGIDYAETVEAWRRGLK